MRWGQAQLPHRISPRSYRIGLGADPIPKEVTSWRFSPPKLHDASFSLPVDWIQTTDQLLDDEELFLERSLVRHFSDGHSHRRLLFVSQCRPSTFIGITKHTSFQKSSKVICKETVSPRTIRNSLGRRLETRSGSLECTGLSIRRGLGKMGTKLGCSA